MRWIAHHTKFLNAANDNIVPIYLQIIIEDILVNGKLYPIQDREIPFLIKQDTFIRTFRVSNLLKQTFRSEETNNSGGECSRNTICPKCPINDVANVSIEDDRAFRKALIALNLDPKMVRDVKSYKCGCDSKHGDDNA